MSGYAYRLPIDLEVAELEYGDRIEREVRSLDHNQHPYVAKVRQNRKSLLIGIHFHL